jgi:hypothetical protein
MPIWPKVLSLFCKRKGKGKRKQNQKAEQLNTVFPHRPSWPRETLQETQSKKQYQAAETKAAFAKIAAICQLQVKV